MKTNDKSAWQSFQDCLNILEEAKRMEQTVSNRRSNPQTGVDVLKNIQEMLNKKL